MFVEYIELGTTTAKPFLLHLQQLEKQEGFT